MKRLIFTLVCLAWIVYNASAQNNIIEHISLSTEEKADMKMNEFAYSDALRLYQKVYDNAEGDNEGVALKIAETYRNLNDQDNAVKWYDKGLTSVQTPNKEHYLYYAEALSSTQKYVEAKTWYNKYLAQMGSHQHAENKINGIDNQKDFFRKVDKVDLQKAAFNSEASDFSPAMLHGEVVFVSARDNYKTISTLFRWDESEYLDMYITNENGAQPFYKSHNSMYHEGPMAFYAGGTKMIFTRNNLQKGKLKKSDDGRVNLMLFSSEVAGEEWTTAQPLALNNDEYSVGHPTLNNEGTTMYFSSDMPNGYGGVDLYRVTWDGSQWSEPLNLGENINTEGDEMFPLLIGKHLYFASNGHQGLGGLDLFGTDIAKNLTSRVINLGAPINSSLDDFGLALNEDELTGYFSSNREEGLNKDNIYQFTSSVSLMRAIAVSGVVTDEYSTEPVVSAKVILMKNNTNVGTVMTDAMGRYTFPLEEDADYQLVVAKEEYKDGSAVLTTMNLDEDDLTKDVVITPDYDFGVKGLVFDHDTKELLQQVHVKVEDNFTKKVIFEGTTDQAGTFGFSLDDANIDDKMSYLVHLTKDGYLGKSVPFNTIIKEPGVIDLSNSMDLSLGKIAVGTDIGKLIDIAPIYFDLGKYSIRKDAAKELDKIVEIMKENPTIEIELGSHTDARGSSVGNLRLSDRRAKSSADYIISKGIDAKRIVGKGYGEALILNKCVDGTKCSEEEHQKNRRTEFKIIKM